MIWLIVLLSLIVGAQYYLFWLHACEGQHQAATERSKLLNRIQTGSAEKANLLNRETTPGKPSRPVIDFPAIDGVEFTGERR